MSKEHTCDQIEKEQEELYEACTEKVKDLIEEAQKRGVILSLLDPPVESYNGEHVKVKKCEWVYPRTIRRVDGKISFVPNEKFYK